MADRQFPCAAHQLRHTLNGAVQWPQTIEPAAVQKVDAIQASQNNCEACAQCQQLCASGIGQTSRVDSLRQAIEKAKSFGFDLNGAVMASDAFFPFPDCVEIADQAGITAVIQPGGSINDKLSVEYCNQHGLAMVKTGVRHFKH